MMTMLYRRRFRTLTLLAVLVLILSLTSGLVRASQETLEQVLQFWDSVNLEDVGIVERVQSGLRARAYTGGRMCYRFEETLHRFQNMVIDRMLGIVRIPEGDEPNTRNT